MDYLHHLAIHKQNGRTTTYETDNRRNGMKNRKDYFYYIIDANADGEITWKNTTEQTVRL